MEITGKIFSLGNSNAIRLPRIIMEALSLKSDDLISISVEGNEALVIKKASGKRRRSIDELFEGYEGDYQVQEWDTGMVGREVL